MTTVKFFAAIPAFASIAAFAFSVGAAQAQTPPPAPARPGILGRLFHPKPKTGIYQSNGPAAHPMAGRPGMMSHSMTGGQIIGNKNSHVYHLPGDKGSLPSPQNRVYFTSAAAAQAAGYHAAGSGHSAMTRKAMTHGTMHGTMTHGTMHGTMTHGTMHGTMMHGTMMHGTMMHGTMMHGTMMHGTMMHGTMPH